MAYTSIIPWNRSLKIFCIEVPCVYYSGLQLNILLLKSLKILEHRMHGYIMVAGTVLYMAGSLRFNRIKHLCFNARSAQCKRRLYTISPCEIQWITLQYRVQKAA